MNTLTRPSTECPNVNALCKSCSNINLQDLKSGQGYEHQPTYGSILLSARTCALCNLIAKSVQRTLQRNRAFKPSVSDSCGPVRLACAGRSLAQQSGLRSCPEGPVEEFLLWREIAILIGDNSMRECSFGTSGAQLVMVAARDSIAEAAGVQGIKPNSYTALSGDNVESLHRLLQNCRRGHPDCSLGFLESLGTRYYGKYGNSGLPSRLVDVRMEDLSKVRVVCVMGRHEYLALSYCWGKPQPLPTTLKKENFVQFQTGIQLSSLGKTIQDAIVLCRKLDVRYLWVDALCIIQDDGVDWSSESQKMALIYAQSYATIASASAKAADESFLSQPRKYFVSAPFRQRSQDLPNGELLFSEPSFDFAEHFETATCGSALARRAWVMQERLFSRRTIHFTTRQIYWECRSLFWAEDEEQTTTLAADSIKTAATFMQTLWSLYIWKGTPTPSSPRICF